MPGKIQIERGGGAARRGILPAVIFAALALPFAAPSPAAALEVSTIGGTYNLKVESFKERKFRAVIRQKYDFSCGSAAVATLLTHHYGIPTDETAVFKAMWTQGDPEKIRTAGFSMLDMHNYLKSRGLAVNGFRTTLDRVAEARVPVIALITTNGYAHFVVVSGISDARVLLADPAAGTKAIPRSEFEAGWNGIVLVVLERVELARQEFNRENDWEVQVQAPVESVASSSLGDLMLHLPSRNHF
jgi:uncharacterized protein